MVFGQQTFKTDAQQVTLSQQLNHFREAQSTVAAQQEQLKKEKQVVNNPFASYNENVLGPIGDLDRADLADQPAYFKPVPLNTVTAAVTQQEVDTPELHQARAFLAGGPRTGPLEDRSDGTAANANL